jgi:uncharacterized protein (DUF488 family)
METPEFGGTLEELVRAAADLRTAIMCAEALWWQCHRRLISDALVAMGHDVRHIQSATAAPSHTLAPPARLVDGQLSYAADQGDLPL